MTALSDYRFRGVSMSDGRPVGVVSINYDDAARGGYAGVSAAELALTAPHHFSAQFAGYAGVVFGAPGAARPELGVSAVHYAADSSYDYAEAFAGVVAERWTLRAYVAPDYFGRGVRTVYGEGAINLPLDSGWRLLTHAGFLAASRRPTPADSRRYRVDALLGAAWSRGRADLQLAWVTASGGGPYPAAYTTRHSGAVLSASLAF